jgi:PAS domain S-box-containing protein
VNDDLTQLNVLCGLLQKAGMMAVPFRSAEAALDEMRQMDPPALIVTDLHMPGIDGWRFCRLLRSPEYPTLNETPILVVSATFSGSEPSQITSGLGANAFMNMPVNGREFIQQAQALIQGEQPRNAPKVLIVDANSVDREHVRSAFLAHGYLARAAASCQECHRLLKEIGFDIAVLDYQLPDGLGDQLLKDLQTQYPGCVCVMTSSRSEPKLALAWMKLGAVACLQKPFEPEYLIAQCERARREHALLRIQDLLEERTQQLRKSEERLRLALDTSTDGLWDWDVPSGEVYHSPGYLRMLGYSQDEFPGDLEGWAYFIHPEERDAVLAAEQACASNETNAIEIEFRMLAKDGSWHWILSRGHPVRRDADGHALQIIGTHTDITERKQLSDALESRLVALTRPHSHPEDINFEELFDLKAIQRLQDEFANATGVASIITHPDGTPITNPSNFCRLCNEIIRITDLGQVNCFRSDSVIGRYQPEGPIIQPCMSGGLWDAGAGISVGGRHIANWLIGQVRDATQTEEAIREYARKIGADEETAAEAFREVPAMSQVQFQRVSQALFTMANQLSTIAYQNVLQARFITENKRIEEMLRSSEQLFRSLFEQTSVGVAIANVHTGEFVKINQRFCDITGYPLADLQSMSDQSITHPEDLEMSDEKMSQLLAGAIHKYSLEKRYIRKDGTTIWTDLNVSGLWEPGEAPSRCVAVIQDITQRKLSEQELRKSEERYHLIDEASQDYIYSYDRQGRFTHANTSLCQLLGLSLDQIIGKTHQELGFPQSQCEEWDALHKQVYQTNQTVVAETTTPIQGDQIQYFEVVLNPIHDETGAIVGIAGTTRDINARKQDEKMIQEQLDELKRWHNITLGREDRIIELKREINTLLTDTGKPPRYASVQRK